MEKLNPESHLRDYIERITFYTPIMNPFLNNRERNWYAEIGEFIYKELKHLEKENLSFYIKEIESLEKKSLIMSFLNKEKKENLFQGLGIMFITDMEDILKKIFGQPFYHSEFGEGFKRKTKSSYASYFLKLGDNTFHVGYDNRGTSFEVKVDKKSHIDSNYTFKFCESIVESIKELVLLIKEKMK